MTLRPSSVPLRVPLLAPPKSSLPSVTDPESDRVRAASPTGSHLLATAVIDPSFQSTAVSALVAELLDFAAACRLDYVTALVAESASASPPSNGGECALGTDVFEERVKLPLGFLPAFKARYVTRDFSQRQGVDYFQTSYPTPKMTTLRVLLHVAAQRDYELHSPDFSTAFLYSSLHEEIWLRRPPGFTGTTLAALGFAPSTADPSLFLCTDTSLPPFYVLLYVDDLIVPTADSEALTLVKSDLHKRHTCTDLGPSALQLPDLLAIARSSVYRPLALSSTFGRVLRWAWGSCLEDGVQLSSLVTQPLLGSSCEAEIYAGAMAAQGLCWLIYVLTDLGEQPHSPLVLYVGNKAMIALCQKHGLEHRIKHIALRYFLARELQQRGQLRLAYVATRANTADVFTKASPPGAHQGFSTVLGL
ncbi:unnamed protein product, partial [Closterium sp. NIES-53]